MSGGIFGGVQDLLFGGSGAPGVPANIATQAGNIAGLGDIAKGWATDDRQRFQDIYQPVENKFVDDALNFDSADNQERAAGAAGGLVRKSYRKVRDESNRNLARFGINPNSGRALDLNKQIDMDQAANEASQMNLARQGIRDRGIALRAGVVNQGNVVGNQASRGLTTAMSGYGASGNLSLGESSALTNKFNAETAREGLNWNKFGDVVGAGAGLLKPTKPN